MRIVFFGTPQFAANILQTLIEKSVSQAIQIVGIVTRSDKPKGRSSDLIAPPVKQIALAHLPEVPLFQPVKASDPEFIKKLGELQADLFVVVAYGQILRQSVLDLPSKGCINVHASLLPKYRGAAPIQRAIMEGERETGITIMQMSLGMDEGDILRQVTMPIAPNMNYQELQDALCELSKNILLETLDAISRGAICPLPQDSSLATYAPKVELVDTQVDFHKTALELHNLVRGVTPSPGAWCMIRIRGIPKKLKIISTRPISETSGNGLDEPGKILEFSKKGLIVACGNGALQLLEVQLEGKKVVSSADFSCGYSLPDISFF